MSDDSIRIGRRLVGGSEGSRSPSPHWRSQTPLALPEQADCLRSCSAATESANAEAKQQSWDRLGSFEMRDAMLAVSKIISIWEQDVSKAAQTWAQHIDIQVWCWWAETSRISSIAELDTKISSISSETTKISSRADGNEDLFHR